MPDTNKEVIRAAKTGDLEKVGTTPLHAAAHANQAAIAQNADGAWRRSQRSGYERQDRYITLRFQGERGSKSPEHGAQAIASVR
jgi:hypothetical protein